MRSFRDVVTEVEKVAAELSAARARPMPWSIPGSDVNLDDDEVLKRRRELADCLGRLETLVQEAIDFPPRHLRHSDKLSDFWGKACYDKSVFVMTKFPVGSSTKDHELQRVIDATTKAVSDAGYEPRIARGPSRYHSLLWDNVELHLLGCRQGVAIVEDRHTDELNPNVTMEWGWMRGMGKPVLFLVEQDFERSRADLDGLIQDAFHWDDPEATVASAIKTWLSRM